MDNYPGDFVLTSYDAAPIKLNYLQYKSCIYNNGYKKCVAYIYKDGAYTKVKPYINTKIEVAIAGIAIPGTPRVSS